MTAFRVRNALLALGVVVLLTFLFVRTRAVDLEEHERYGGDVRRLREMDARLNQDVLKSRDALLPYYDPLVAELAELKRLQGRLENIPRFVDAGGRRALRAKLAVHRTDLLTKEEMIERFKSRQAVLRNSLDYLSVLAGEFAGGASRSRGRMSGTLVSQLLRDVLTYILSPTDELEASIERQRIALGTRPGGSRLGTFLRHAQKIVTTKPEVDALSRGIVLLPTARDAEALYQTYATSYGEALRTAGFYRGWLYLFAVVLVGYVASSIVRLRNSALALQAANEGLEERVEERTRELEAEVVERKRAEEQSERLLRNILPEPIALRLKNAEHTIADSYPQVTVLFADIVGFTALSGRVAPERLVTMLNEVFSSFDRLAARHDLEKIKTIGDAYMVVGGLPNPRSDHAEAVAEMALQMREEMGRFRWRGEESVDLRIGIHSGPVVAGVIGEQKFSYDLWGDTVNLASRMESHGVAGCIQVSRATYERLKECYRFIERGPLEIRGYGELKTYLLEGRHSHTPDPPLACARRCRCPEGRPRG